MNLEQRHNQLVDEYNELNKKIQSLDKFINGINFEHDVKDADERILMCHQLSAMRGYRANLKCRILYLRDKMENENRLRQVCGDAIATNHCGQDAAHYRALVESQGIHIHDGNTPPEVWGDLKSLLGMEVIALTRAKCQSCPQEHYGTPCVKLELVGGIYICLAPKPQDNA